MKKFVSILSVMVLLVCSLAAFGLSAAAVDSPSGNAQFSINITNFNTGKPTSSKTAVKNGDTYTFTADESDYDFTGWVISGDYEIVSGGLNQKTITIRPKSDVTVEQTYNVQGSQGYGKDAIVVGKINASNESPKTGNQALAMVSVVAMGAFATMVLAKKRLAK